MDKNETVKNGFEQADDTGDNPLVVDGSFKRNGESLCFERVITCSLAEINAGVELVPAVTGKQIKVVDFAALANGSLAASTSVDIEEDSSSHTKIGVILTAALANGYYAKPDSANVSRGAGFMALLTASQAVRAVNVGNTGTTLTSIQFVIQYQVI